MDDLVSRLTKGEGILGRSAWIEIETMGVHAGDRAPEGDRTRNKRV